MKALFYFIIALCILEYINSKVLCNDVMNPRIASKCFKKKKESGAHKCCYLSYYINGDKNTFFNKCLSISKDQYNNQNNLLNQLSSVYRDAYALNGYQVNINDMRIDCASSYLKLSIIGLILILL